jgi:ERF superfamily
MKMKPIEGEIDNKIVAEESSTEIAIAPSVVSSPAQLLSTIIEMSRDDSLNIDKLKVLLEMQQQMEIRQAEIEFNRALARLSSKLPQIPRNGTVSLGQGKGSYPFARWEDMDKIIRPLMAEEGFVLSFTTSDHEGGSTTIIGKLRHRDGHNEVTQMSLPPDHGPGRNNLQAQGSTLSYGKRYCAEMLLNIVREGVDNDGAGAKRGFATNEPVRR